LLKYLNTSNLDSSFIILAINLKNLQINQIENLLTKKEFNIFEKEMINFQENIKDSRNELKTNIKELKVDIGDFKKEAKVDIENFKEELRGDIQELRTEMVDFKKEVKADMDNLLSKKEFYNEIQKANLSLTIKLGSIMVTGVGVIGFFLNFKFI
jgi:hypothetical protein